jgi:hypothetical protein
MFVVFAAFLIETIKASKSGDFVNKVTAFACFYYIQKYKNINVVTLSL